MITVNAMAVYATDGTRCVLDLDNITLGDMPAIMESIAQDYQAAGLGLDRIEYETLYLGQPWKPQEVVRPAIRCEYLTMDGWQPGLIEARLNVNGTEYFEVRTPGAYAQRYCLARWKVRPAGLHQQLPA